MTGKVRAWSGSRRWCALPGNYHLVFLRIHRVLGCRARRWCGSFSGCWRRRCRGSTPSRAFYSKTCAAWALRARPAFDVCVDMSYGVIVSCMLRPNGLTDAAEVKRV